jgi:hypothetical protein
MRTHLWQNDYSRDLNRQAAGFILVPNCYFAQLMVSAVT